MTTSKRIYIRPDEDLSREEGIRQVVNALARIHHRAG